MSETISILESESYVRRAHLLIEILVNWISEPVRAMFHDLSCFSHTNSAAYWYVCLLCWSVKNDIKRRWRSTSVPWKTLDWATRTQSGWDPLFFLPSFHHGHPSAVLIQYTHTYQSTLDSLRFACSYPTTPWLWSFISFTGVRTSLCTVFCSVYATLSVLSENDRDKMYVFYTCRFFWFCFPSIAIDAFLMHMSTFRIPCFCMWMRARLEESGCTRCFLVLHSSSFLCPPRVLPSLFVSSSHGSLYWSHLRLSRFRFATANSFNLPQLNGTRLSSRPWNVSDLFVKNPK